VRRALRTSRGDFRDRQYITDTDRAGIVAVVPGLLGLSHPVVKTNTLRRTGAVLLGAPAPIELGEILSRFGRQVLRLDLAGQSNGHLDLLKLGGTVGAQLQMSLESPSIPTG